MAVKLGSHQAIEVDLLGEIYTVNPPVRSMLSKLEKIDEKTGGAGTHEEYVQAVTEALDLRLASTKDRQPKPSTVLRKAWRDDKLTVQQLDALVDDIGAQDRPT